jgi:hypothetical protein
MTLRQYLDQRGRKFRPFRWALLVPLGVWFAAPPHYSLLWLPAAIILFGIIAYALRGARCPRCHKFLGKFGGDYLGARIFGEADPSETPDRCPHCGLRLDEEIGPAAP